jgi:membrane protein DedA with SNARE-associated domain
MTHVLVELVSRFGYVMVFLGVGIESLGIPVPGETSLVIGAVVAGHGELSPWGVALSGWSGAVIGDNFGYLVGRRWGRRILTVPVIRRIYDPRRIAVADRFFERRGWLAVFFGRFVAILRIFAGPLAGLHVMPWRVFAVANATGGALWVSAVTLVGLLIGSNLDRALKVVSRAGYVGLGVAIIVVVALVVRHIRATGREREEGARALAERGQTGQEGER